MTIPNPTKSISASSLSHGQLHRAVGALIGAAVGDALGAPFEFGPDGQYSETFPTPLLTGCGEMTGGGAFQWAPGEFTDDTQMAIVLAESLVACGGSFDPEHTFQRFQAWATTAVDIGSTTSGALRGDDWRTAAKLNHEIARTSAGNGCIMRVSPVGIAGVVWGPEETARVAYEQARLTHWEQGAGVGAAITAELIRRTIVTGTFTQHINDVVAFVAGLPYVSPSDVALYMTMLSDAWNPFNHDGPGNGSVWTCLAQAVWCVRNASSYAEAITTAIDLGGDTDTVAAVTGSFAGALFGIQQIPVRWVSYINGVVSRIDGSVSSYNNLAMHDLARELLTLGPCHRTETEPPAGPQRVHDAGVWAANLEGAALAPLDFAVVSMCVTEDRFAHHQHRREVYVRDEEGSVNSALGFVVRDAVAAVSAYVAEGRQVVVHCHGGRSRTGLVLKAWHMFDTGSTASEAHEWLEREWRLYATYNQTFGHFLEKEWPFIVAEMKAGHS